MTTVQRISNSGRDLVTRIRLSVIDPRDIICISSRKNNTRKAKKYQPNNKRQQTMPFIKGKSGNPRGRPLGARGKKTLAREAALRAEAAAEAQAIVDGWLGARGRRVLLGAPRPAKSPPARLPADTLPYDTQSAASAVATLLGVDAETVMDAVGLTGGEAADWFDDAL
jgi:hypothetical protein